MLKLSKMTDYAVLLLVGLLNEKGHKLSVSELSSRTVLPEPTISKVLKKLSKSGLVLSHRGIYGGYSFEGDENLISVADIIIAIEGRTSVTACAGGHIGNCDLSSNCKVTNNWQIVNDAIYNSLDNIKLSDMASGNDECLVAKDMVKNMVSV